MAAVQTSSSTSLRPSPVSPLVNMAAEGQSLAPKEVFESVDADHDGLITKEEAGELVKKLDLEIDHEAVDKLFEGEHPKETISFEEFESLLHAEA